MPSTIDGDWYSVENDIVLDRELDSPGGRR